MDVLYLPPCIHNSSSFFNSEKVEVSTDVWGRSFSQKKKNMNESK